MEITDYKRTSSPPIRTTRVTPAQSRHADAAKVRARDELGRLWPKRPGRGFTPAGFPLVGDDQVYVFRTGAVFHPLACPDVVTGWTRARAAVAEGLVSRRVLSIVVLRQSVGRRRGCARCASIADERRLEDVA